MPGTTSAPDMCLALHTMPEIVQEINLFFLLAKAKLVGNNLDVVWVSFLKCIIFREPGFGMKSGIIWAVIVCRMGMTISRPKVTF